MIMHERRTCYSEYFCNLACACLACCRSANFKALLSKIPASKNRQNAPDYLSCLLMNLETYFSPSKLHKLYVQATRDPNVSAAQG